jgi:beta-phosphoglucomutase-like phosphatase (HAD superfamily)
MPALPQPAFTLDEPFSALIFDCDGTLVDTGRVHFMAVNEALRPLGVAIELDWYRQRSGLTPAHLYAEVERDKGIRLDVPAISSRYGPIFLASLASAEEIAVVADVARGYHGVVPMAVASNGERPNVVATLRATGLLPLFDHIVTAEEVARGKPAPDVYLEAARRMQVAPASCLVFEDTEEGLTAARAAGMRVRDIRLVFQP